MPAPIVLVTGFSPFPSAPLNPTAWLIDRLRNDAWHPKGVRLSPHVLPTRFDVFETTLQPLITELAPAAVVSFGLSAKAKGVTLERFARNAVAEGWADVAGVCAANTTLDPAGRSLRASTLPLAAAAQRLEDAGVPWEWSEDAGDYICNLVFYRTLGSCAQSGAPSGFVHVPYTDTMARTLNLDGAHATLSEDQLLAGAKAVLSTVAETILC